MGTSEAAGYVTPDGNVMGWFNELAFAPVDLSERAMRDEWSGDVGVGCKYFSQDAVIKLAPAAGIALSDSLSPAEKLKYVQKMAEDGVPSAVAIFRSIGAYLCPYRSRCTRGCIPSAICWCSGASLPASAAKRLWRSANAYSPKTIRSWAKEINVTLPDENMRRVGQSIAAASLPQL